MGIPHLIQTLQSLYKPKARTFSGDQNLENGESVKPAAIIDGSSLAYHVLYLYLAQATSAINRSHAVIGFDYAAYQKVVVRWLANLESGFRITHIFVDGHLPSYKSETRQSRIKDAISGLTRLRNLTPEYIDLSKSNGWTPTPPFLIAAFQSAIQTEAKYSKLLCTVGGEADAYCAHAAASFELRYPDDLAVIFTSDSDLVVYPSSQYTRIAFLKDVRFEHLPTHQEVNTKLWSPNDISETISPGGEETMVKFAWCLTQDPMKIASLTSKTSKPVLKNVRVPTWYSEQYTLPAMFPTLDTIPPTITDSRIAEAIFQSPIYAKYAHPRIKDEEISLYLPVLVEDPTKPSAWEIGSDYRHIAYQLLYLEGAEITEFYRKAGSLGKRSVNLGNDVSDQFLKPQDTSPTLGNVPHLITCIILEVLKYNIEHHIMISEYDVLAIAAAVTEAPTSSSNGTISLMENRWTWSRNQLFSQLQAGIYSICLLKQVASLPAVQSKSNAEEAQKATNKLPSLLNNFNLQRFIEVYSLMPKTSKRKAKKKAAKLLKTENQKYCVTDAARSLVRTMFKEEDRAGIEVLLQAVQNLKASLFKQTDSGAQVGEEEEGEDTYMGMSIG